MVSATLDKDTHVDEETLKSLDFPIPCENTAHNEEHIPEQNAWGLIEYIMPCGFHTQAHLCQSGYEFLCNIESAVCIDKSCGMIHARRDVHLFFIRKVNR